MGKSSTSLGEGTHTLACPYPDQPIPWPAHTLTSPYPGQPIPWPDIPLPAQTLASPYPGQPHTLACPYPGQPIPWPAHTLACPYPGQPIPWEGNPYPGLPMPHKWGRSKDRVGHSWGPAGTGAEGWPTAFTCYFKRQKMLLALKKSQKKTAYLWRYVLKN